MGHVSRTHSVDFDRLHDRVNLDLTIQITYVNQTFLTRIIHKRQIDTTDTIGEHHY